MNSGPGDIAVGVTNRDWYDFLRGQNKPEVNFWSPSDTRMQLQQGSLFLFRVKGVRKIAGGAIFFRSDVLTVREAWDFWGSANGCADEETFAGRLLGPGRDKKPRSGDSKIGCSSMIEAFYLDEEDWFEAPECPKSLQRYKIYRAADPLRDRLLGMLRERLAPKNELHLPKDAAIEDLGRPRPLQRYSLGPGAFRLQIRDNYNRQCAVSAEKTLPVLEAAHIRPYSKYQDHSLDNGLLLRADIRKLYSEGLVSITPDRRFHVSAEIRKRYRNGRVYYELEGKEVSVPEDEAMRPNPAFLQEHYDTLFKR